jgi:hypothetical protein
MEARHKDRGCLLAQSFHAFSFRSPVVKAFSPFLEPARR